MKTSNNIVYKVSKIAKKGEQFDIVIRLNDECKNGHNDFSITGTIYEAGKSKIERNSITSGAIGDDIAKAFPKLAIFNNLHLCDRKGAPMHAAANMLYHLQQGEMSEQKFCMYYRVNSDQYKSLYTAEDQQFLKYLLYTTGVVEQWQAEADTATAILEEMTGLKFIDDSVRYQLEPLTDDESKEIESRVNSGYYSAEAKQERTAQLRQQQRDKLVADITKDFNTATAKAKNEFEAKMLVLDSNLSLDNFIFYNHTLTGCFNWKSYDKKVTQEEFNGFVESVKDKTPEGVTWELK